MMTVAEAMQRARMHQCTIRRVPGSRNWRVERMHWTHAQSNEHGYVTDDLEDAVLMMPRLPLN